MSIFLGNKQTRQHIQALARCKQPENANLLDLFRGLLEETKTSLVTAEELGRIQRLQGRAEALSDFLDAVEKSQGVLERVDKRPA
jgi:hypothetical protein